MTHGLPFDFGNESDYQFLCVSQTTPGTCAIVTTEIAGETVRLVKRVDLLVLVSGYDRGEPCKPMIVPCQWAAGRIESVCPRGRESLFAIVLPTDTPQSLCREQGVPEDMTTAVLDAVQRVVTTGLESRIQ